MIFNQFINYFKKKFNSIEDENQLSENIENDKFLSKITGSKKIKLICMNCKWEIIVYSELFKYIEIDFHDKDIRSQKNLTIQEMVSLTSSKDTKNLCSKCKNCYLKENIQISKFPEYLIIFLKNSLQSLFKHINKNIIVKTSYNNPSDKNNGKIFL